MNYKALSIAAATGLLISTGAFAQGYVGLGVGSTKISDSCEGTITCDTTDTGFKVFGGYKFTPNVAGELTYLNFGKAKATANTQVGIVSAELKPTAVAIGVALVGDLAPNVPAAARLGVARVKVDVSGSAGPFSVADNETSTQPHLGLAVGYAFSKSLSLDAAYDYSRAKYGDSTDDVHLLSIGLTFSF